MSGKVILECKGYRNQKFPRTSMVSQNTRPIQTFSPQSVQDFDQSFLQFQFSDPFRKEMPEKYKPVAISSREVRKLRYEKFQQVVSNEMSKHNTMELLQKISDSDADLSYYSHEEVFETFGTPETPPEQIRRSQNHERDVSPFPSRGQKERTYSNSTSCTDVDSTTSSIPDLDSKVKGTPVASAPPTKPSTSISSLSLNIDSYDEIDFLHVLEDLRENPRIARLAVHRGNAPVLSRTEEDLALLFAVLETMPHLENLELHHFEASDLDALDELLEKKPSKLTRMKVELHDLHV